VVKWLLAKHGIDPNPTLSLATANGQETMVRLLLAKAGVDSDFKDGIYGRMPLLQAVETGNEAVVKLLFATDRVDPVLELQLRGP
jgi:ankyrin repeat protein